MGSLDHAGFARVKERLGQRIFSSVFGEESGVGVGDADQFDVGMLQESGEKSLHVAVGEADNGDAQRRRLGRAAARGGEQDSRQQTVNENAGKAGKTRHSSKNSPRRQFYAAQAGTLRRRLSRPAESQLAAWLCSMAAIRR